MNNTESSSNKKHTHTPIDFLTENILNTIEKNISKYYQGLSIDKENTTELILKAISTMDSKIIYYNEVKKRLNTFINILQEDIQEENQSN